MVPALGTTVVNQENFHWISTMIVINSTCKTSNTTSLSRT